MRQLTYKEEKVVFVFVFFGGGAGSSGCPYPRSGSHTALGPGNSGKWQWQGAYGRTNCLCQEERGDAWTQVLHALKGMFQYPEDLPLTLKFPSPPSMPLE